MKLKTFPIMISKQFMKGHPRAGEDTQFREKILNGRGLRLKDSRDLIYLAKIHTLRNNYEYWARIANEVNAGRGVLSLRQWTGSPYNYQRDGSKPKEFLRLPKMGVQKLEWAIPTWSIDGKKSDVSRRVIATNDGLALEDFNAWFTEPTEPMAIIHFTDFRYGTSNG